MVKFILAPRAFSAVTLLASAAAASFLVAAPAQAQTLRAEHQRESLDVGSDWSTSTLGVDHKLEGVAGKAVRLHAALEQDVRPMGEARRAYAQAGMELIPGTALEIGVGAGTGAAYSWRKAAHVTVYQGWGKLELSATVARMQYVDSTLQRTSLNARMPLGLGVTGIAGLSSSHTQGRVAGPVSQLGLERHVGSCVLTGTAYFGRELLAPEDPMSQLIKSKTYHVKTRCPVSARVSLELSASTTRAEQLSRQGVSGALVFAY
jgi:hypothetical protein